MAFREETDCTTQTTELLQRISTGDSDAYNQLFVQVYDELRARAHRLARGVGKTLSTTAVVHEAYIKLAGVGLTLNDESHFYALAARAMRQVVCDAVRDKGAYKRGGDLLRDTLESGLVDAGGEMRIDFLALDQALQSLAATSPRLAQVVELHFFAGLGFADIARLLGLTERTIARDWRAARVLLQSRLDAAVR